MEDKKIYKCPTCHRVFTSKGYRDRHMKTIQCKGKNFRGEQCSASFYNKNSLEKHLEGHFKDNLETHKCAICNRVYSSKHARDEHICIVHNNQKYFPCVFCGNSFAHKTGLNIHIRWHIGENDHCIKEYRCSYCDKVSFGIIDHRHHMKTEHKRLKCETCGLTFSCKKTLQSHMLTHGNKTFSCQLCGHRTFTVQGARRHLKSHTGEKPYKCKICLKSFRLNLRLQAHIFDVHDKKNKPFKCSFCEKKFSVKNKLTVHERVHTGEKPYKCKLCPKAYREDGGIRHHMRTIH